MRRPRRDPNRSVPGGATVIGREGPFATGATEALVRHDHTAVGLHNGLPPQTVRSVGGGQVGAPGKTAVGRGGHLLEVNLECVVELGVAVAEEGAAGRVVTDGPVLVEERALCRHRDGSAPGDALVCRTANHHVHNAASSLVSAQPGDQPDVMTEVEGHRWVTRGEEW